MFFIQEITCSTIIKMLSNTVDTLRRCVFTAFNFNQYNQYAQFCIKLANIDICPKYQVQGNLQKAVIYYMNSLISELKSCIASKFNSTSNNLTNTRPILKECESSFDYNKFVIATLVTFAIMCLGYGITKFMY